MQVVWAMDWERYGNVENLILGAAWITTFLRTQDNDPMRRTDRLHFEYAGYGDGPASLFTRL